VRHNAFSTPTKLYDLPAQILPLYFALVGCLPLSVNRGSGVLLIPDVTNLITFPAIRAAMTPKTTRECQITIASDAALQTQLRLRATEEVHKRDLPACHVVTFRPTPWASQQKSRVDTITVEPGSDEVLSQTSLIRELHMSLHVFGNIVTPFGTAAINRAENEGNITTLQKLIWHGAPHSTVSAEAIRFALLRLLAEAEDTGTNRSWNEDARVNEWEDHEFKGWGEKPGKTFIDDDLPGFIVRSIDRFREVFAFEVYVTVPVACFRRGMAREYLETELIPPPSTCYGFLLSLVGETDRHRHVRCRVTSGIFGEPDISVVLRTVWRVKSTPLGSAGNTRPDYQQLLTDVRLIIWLDSSEEPDQQETLERRVRRALNPAERGKIERFGGLSLGESRHMVDIVSALESCQHSLRQQGDFRMFHVAEAGRLTLPVWVDHVGSSGTRYATGNLENTELGPPALDRMPVISP